MASDALARFGISRDELEAEISKQAETNAAINDFMEKEVVPYARAAAGHIRSGKFAAQIKVTKKAKNGRGRVTATAWYSHFIEYGTKADKKGKEPRRVFTQKDGWRTLPKDTPTEALAPMTKTAKHFGGTIGYDGGITLDTEGDE